jgi:hypothetical protein
MVVKDTFYQEKRWINGTAAIGPRITFHQRSQRKRPHLVSKKADGKT